MEKPKYIYTEKEGNASVTLTVDVDNAAKKNMSDLLIVLEKLGVRISKDLEELKTI